MIQGTKIEKMFLPAVFPINPNVLARSLRGEKSQFSQIDRFYAINSLQTSLLDKAARKTFQIVLFTIVYLLRLYIL